MRNAVLIMHNAALSARRLRMGWFFCLKIAFLFGLDVESSKIKIWFHVESSKTIFDTAFHFLIHVESDSGPWITFSSISNMRI